MECIIKTLPKTNHFNIVPLSDIHYGNINCDLKKFKEALKYISQTDNCYMILMGDMCEGITISDKRLDILSVPTELRDRIDNIAMAEYEEMRNMLLPYKDRIIAGLRGNHGEVMRKQHGVDFDGWLYKDLGVANAGYMSFIRVKVDKSRAPGVNIFAQHGFSSSRKKGAKVNAVEDLAAGFDADIYLLGHSHELNVSTNIYLSMNQYGNLEERKRYFCHTGSYLKSYTKGAFNYSEVKCYPPLKTGCIKLTFDIKRNDQRNEYFDIHARE